EVFASSIEAAAMRIKQASSSAAKAPVRVLVLLAKGPSEQEGSQMSEVLAAAQHAPPAVFKMPHDAQVQDLRADIALRSRGTLYVAAIKRRPGGQLLSSSTTLSSLGKAPVEVEAIVTGYPGSRLYREAGEAVRAATAATGTCTF
ncbi:hypothetical protein DUNSADRAFT_2350, partial [Dunaliella salina]